MTWDALLLTWYTKEGRKLPWRETTNPYHIIVSEFMLQQTQVDRVIPKYLHWLKQFPTWEELAQAKRSKVLIAWSGLGYNSRAVRLQTLAKVLIEEYGGVLPTNEEELQKLPGLGPYTAGAIRSFAFDLPGNCVDVNVERVIKRTSFSLRKTPTRADVETTLASIQKKHSPRALANALMDLGSTYCKAKNPLCDTCPVRSGCLSKGERKEEQIVRAKKKTVAFLHSNRWWRGQILKELTKSSASSQKLFSSISGVPEQQQKFENALTQLKEEKLVSGNKKLALTD